MNLIDSTQRAFIPDQPKRWEVAVWTGSGLACKDRRDPEREMQALSSLASNMHRNPIALEIQKRNRQNYEVLAAYFKRLT